MSASEDAMPQSVEEAGALLGAAITRYGKGSFVTNNPPKGIHSSFAVMSPVPSSELLGLLHTLRSLLRSAPKETPLVAAPSLLAGVLMKLLGISSSLAAKIPSNDDPSKPRNDIPPMLSTAIRRVWVDCVVLCHSLGEGLSGAQRINLFGFVRDMIILAGLNPRTARALGGTRIAALEVISGLLEDKKLSVKLASWAFDVAQLCQRALKSSGNGEPSYRIAAIRVACSVAVASRSAFMKTREIWGSAQFVLKGALEDKATFEMVKVLKIASQDRYPEVRSSATQLACLLGPMAINLHIKSSSSPDAEATSPTSCLEEIMTLAFRNLDDDSANVSEGWAEALARLMSTSIELKNQSGSDSISTPDASTGRGAKKGMLSAEACSTLPKAIKYLVSVFIKVGGDLAAPRAGGNYSLGGRAVRVGFARTIIHLLRLQLQIQSIGEGRSLSYRESIVIILAMVGKDMETQLNPIDRGVPPIPYLDASTVVTSRISSSSGSSAFPPTQKGRNLFGQGPKVSHADGCIARLLTNQVLRDGLAQQMTEISQLKVLHELVDLCSNKQSALQGNQLQVILVEISHLFATLGEATASSLEQILPGLLKCLSHSNHGVRHEAAVTFGSIASVFPSEGRKIVRECINKIQFEHAEMMSTASTGEQSNATEEINSPRFRFRRETPTKKKSNVDETLKHQYTIHGISLVVATLIRDLPDLPGGLPTEILDTVMSICEFLISTSTNDVIKEVSPSSICTCIRAGFCLIAAVLTTGPDAMSNHIASIFGLWQKVCETAQSKDNFTADHEMMCVESLLTSIVTFLKFGSELLLSIPDALSRTSLILENLLPLFFSKGRLGSIPVNPTAACRLDSAKASIMEAFAWLPPGSFPMIADSVFGFAASHIQKSIQDDVSCSILPSLISKEDRILDTISFDRAKEFGQVGGAHDLGRDIFLRTSEVAHHGDRESALLFLRDQNKREGQSDDAFLDSEVLGLLNCERKEKPPTVLHEVGTWRKPVDPSCATRIRLVDASVQAFASTFALRSGKEQQKAMDILHSLLPPLHFQKGRNAGLTDQDRTGKIKDNLAPATNIVAVILSCVKALPIEESTHDIAIGLGPSWKNKASTILISILSSRANDVRRAAAEGLAVLSTLGIKEDMRFLQSAVLHSLDEVISRNPSQGQGRNALQDNYQNGRSGGLLTLACIQRSTHRITESRASRSRLRGSPAKSKHENEDSLQTIQIMTRVLPYVGGRLSSGISLNARASALHSILMLLQYSGKMNCIHLNEEDLHLLKKAVEIVEDNYMSAWTVASHVLDQGNETQKIAFEPSFLSVILRFMTFLTPLLHQLEDYDAGIARRFSTMAMIIVECYGDHAVVQLEALAFFEVLAINQDLLPARVSGIKYDEHPLLSCIPYLMANISPNRSPVLSRGMLDIPHGCNSSPICLRGSLRTLRALSVSEILVAEWSDMEIISLLFAALEATSASNRFFGEVFNRGLAAPREAETICNGNKICGEVSDILRFMIYLERVSPKCEYILLRYILLSRSIVAGISVSEEVDDDNAHTIASVSKAALEQASFDSKHLFELSNPIRWQVKVVAVQMMTIALMELATKCREDGTKLEDTRSFNPRVAQIECLDACNLCNSSDSNSPKSALALHIPELIAAGCVVATATVDQVELRILQENSMYCLAIIIGRFGAIPDPDESHTSVLNQYIPQLSSCIKSALTAPDDNIDESTCRLFWAGCNALCSLIRSQVTNEVAVLKRLIRPTILNQEEVPFFEAGSSMPKNALGIINELGDQNVRSILLLKIGKMFMLGNIPLENPEISRMIEPDKSCIGVHAASLAVDGAKVLISSNLTLCGEPSDKKRIQTKDKSDGFFSFQDICEIDDYTKAALTRTWATNARLSIEFLLDAINSPQASETEAKACLEWLERVIPFMFSGLYDAISAVGESCRQGTISWAKQVDACEVACCCLAGLSTLSGSGNISHLSEKWKHEIETSAVQIYKSILLPALVNNGFQRGGGKGRYDNEDMTKLIVRSCALLVTFSATISFEEDSDSCPFLVTLLSPLDLLEKNEISVTSDIASEIVAACLNAVARIIGNNGPSTLAKAMLPFALSLLTRPEKSSALVSSASQELLVKCLNHESTSTAELSVITLGLAKSRNWSAWSSAVKINDGIAAEESLLEIEKALLNPTNTEEQLGALGAIREMVQNNPPPNALTGRILSALGAEVFSVFQAYGSLSNPSVELQSHRVAACAGCMKIALASYQQCSTDFPESEDTTEFLIVLFEVLIAVLRFNGLPNHPPPQGPLSDSSIGRMCAQAITHVARTTPIPFKASMGRMADHDRAVLEFAVRGEMSGYAVATTPAPVKKKLSLKGFSKR